MDFVASTPWQMWATYAIILVTIVLYAVERFPIEIVSAASLAALLLLFQGAPLLDASGRTILDAEDLFAGFASPGLIAIMALLIIGQGLFQSGSTDFLTRYLVIAQEKAPRLVPGAVLLLAFGTSAFLNDTPVVVMFIPIVAAIASTGKIPPSRLMMPLSFVALFGGMLTVIGSSTNILASASYYAVTGEEIGFFDLTPMAGLISVAGLLYLATAGQFLLPRRDVPDPAAQMENKQFVAEIEVTPGHFLVGKSAVSGLFPDLPDVTVRMVVRRGEAVLPPYDDFSFRPHDILIIAATRAALTKLLKASPETLQGMLSEIALETDGGLRSSQLSMVEAVVAPGSRMIARTIAETGFQLQTNCVVIGIERRSRMIRSQMNTIRLDAGDVLLIVGPTASVQALRADRDLLVLEWSMTGIPALRHARLAAAIFIGVVALAATGVVPIAVSAFAGALAMVGADCLNIRQAARAVDRRIFMLVGSSLAMGLALEETGGAAVLGRALAASAEHFGPTALLSAIFAITAVVTNVLSNNATAVLFVPIAVSAAAHAGVDPKLAAMTVVYGANCPFATPIGYQTNLLVMTPGHYRFRDFLVVGGPMIILLWVVFTVAAPRWIELGGRLF